MPEMHAVSSSNVRQVGYDAEARELWVRFWSSPNLVYVYHQVPERIFRGLMKAWSVGEYVNDHVKGRYRYRRVRWPLAA